MSTSSLYQKRRAERLATIKYPKFQKRQKSKKDKNEKNLKTDDSLKRLVASPNHRFASMFSTDYGSKLTNTHQNNQNNQFSPELKIKSHKKRPVSSLKCRPIMKLSGWNSYTRSSNITATTADNFYMNNANLNRTQKMKKNDQDFEKNIIVKNGMIGIGVED